MLSFKYKIGMNYGKSVEKAVNEYFNTNKKIIRLSKDISYLETCINNNVLPDFTQLRVASNKLKNNRRFLEHIRVEMIEEELRIKKSLMYKHKKELRRLQNECFDVSAEERNYLTELTREKCVKLGNRLSPRRFIFKVFLMRKFH